MGYWHGLLLASLASLSWGISPIFQKRALNDMGIHEMNAARGAGVLAGLFLLFFFIEKDALNLQMESYLILAFIAIVNNMVGDLLAFIAIRDIGVSLSTPITSSYPLAVALISWLCYDEPMSRSVLGGTFAVVTGLILLNVRWEGAGGADARRLRGAAAAMSAALCWALGLSLNKHLILNGVGSAALIFWRGAIFSVMAFGILPLKARFFPSEKKRVSWAGCLAGAMSGVLGMIFGAGFYAASLFMIPMNVATPVASSSPLIAVLIACAFMGERLRPLQWLGFGFVVAGAVAVSI